MKALQLLVIAVVCLIVANVSLNHVVSDDKLLEMLLLISQWAFRGVAFVALLMSYVEATRRWRR